MTSRPWSRYSKGSSAYNRLHPDDKPVKTNSKSALPAENEDLDEEEKAKVEEDRKKKGKEMLSLCNLQPRSFKSF